MEPTRRSRTSRRRTRRRVAVAALATFVVLAAIVAGALLAGRGDDPSSPPHVFAAPTDVATLPTTTAAPSPTTTTLVAPATTVVAVAPEPSNDATATPTRPPPATAVAPGTSEPSVEPAEPPLPEPLAEAGDADQVVVVTANDYGETTATLSAYERVGGGWHLVFGPWDANIGSHGLAPPNEKTEGDGRTPSGSFGFDFFFGVEPDPGVRFPYREITDSSIVWDDDPASARYNQWVDTRIDDAGLSPEPMHQVPAYSYGAVLAYNGAGTPGLGSAIFLHVSTGSPTAGCVSLPVDDLLALLRWLDPSKQPRIVLGVQPT